MDNMMMLDKVYTYIKIYCSLFLVKDYCREITLIVRGFTGDFLMR
jgi:hypothetical protein